MILYQIAKYAHLEGMKLLSQIKEIENVSENFIKYIKVFICLVSANPTVERPAPDVRQRINSALLRRPFSQAANTNNVTKIHENRPENFDDVEREFSALWTLMESWMSILHSEMKNDSTTNGSEIDSLETSPRLSDDKEEETTSLRSFTSRLRNSNHKLFRSISRTSTNVEQQLRLSQPAYTINNYEDSALYLPRSDSYSMALNDIDDRFEVRSTVSASTISLGEKDEDNHILDLTADRLCATINGFHMYCSCAYSWDRRCLFNLLFLFYF